MKKEYLYGIIAAEIIGIIAACAFGYWLYTTSPTNEEEGAVVVEDIGFPTATTTVDGTDAATSTEGGAPPTQGSVPGGGKIKADVFTGKLEKVDTGCFADGECYIVVDGKHITALTGMRANPEPVGTVQGVPGFGDLESHIGEMIEVYARVNPDNTYSLYGSEGFYIKLTTSAPVKPKPTGGCVVGGCSSQMCVDASKGDMATTCEYAEHYACYQTATCERQVNGQCGWTETPALSQCLVDKGGVQVQ